MPQLPKGCVIGDKKTGVCYAGNLGGAPESSEEVNALNIFIQQYKDRDDSDRLFYDYMLKIQDNKKNKLYYLWTPQAKAKLDIKALDNLKELNKETKEAILSYRDKTKNNDTGLRILITEDYGIFYFIPDGVTYNLNATDYNAVFDKVKCYKYGQGKCEDIPLKEAWYFIFPKSEIEALVSYLFG